jgi:hypothetical protein
VTDFTTDEHILDLRGLVGTQSWAAIGDVVRVTDTAAYSDEAGH